MASPFLGLIEWAGPQEAPWEIQNANTRALEGFALHTSVKSRVLTAPPVSCNDGDRYLVAAGGSGLWNGQDGKVAIAVGANASNGWLFANVEHTDTQIFIEAENKTLRRLSSGAWAEGTFVFVDLTGAADGGTLRYDLSNGVFYVA